MRAIRIQNLIAAAVIAAGLAVPGLSQARAAVYVNVAPPAPVVETVPAPRAGYVWAPGYHHWNGHNYVWTNGHYVHARTGQRWVAHHWERHGNGWTMREGHWVAHG